MRVRYCWTIACDVVRPDVIAACISAMLASKTSNAAGFDAVAGFCCAGDSAPAASARTAIATMCLMAGKDNPRAQRLKATSTTRACAVSSRTLAIRPSARSARGSHSCVLPIGSSLKTSTMSVRSARCGVSNN